MSQSARHKGLFISDLEWLVMPAILLKQFRIFYKDETPVGLVLWARISDEVEARLTQPNARLQPKDWRSGHTLKIVEVVAPFGGAEELRAQSSRK